MKLYVFDHCPYCIRTLLAFGLKKQPVEVVYIREDDSETPTKMIGKQMVPILEYESGKYMPESLDIVNYVDGKFDPTKIFIEAQNPLISQWVEENARMINYLVMPRYAKMDLPELDTPSARALYRERHEKHYGNFDEHYAKSDEYKKSMEKSLSQLAEYIDLQRIEAEKYSLDDIILFPFLKGLTAVKGLLFPDKVQKYTLLLAKQANLELFDHKAC